ncbi:MAG: T9SS type A sorting domain-containing protein [Cytophagaceae bacterium]
MKSRVTHIFLFLLLNQIHFAFGQNLIVNPGAELPPIGNGWTEAILNAANPVTPYHWTQANSGSGGVAPHGGTYHFYAGDNSNGNYYIYQDIDVSAYATAIDGNTASFVFSYWFRTFQFNNDQGRLILNYLDVNNNILSTYNSGVLTFPIWSQYSDTRTAPVNTRKIRISLINYYLSGSDTDGYFDDLSLTTTAPMPVDLLDFSVKKINANTYQANWLVTNETNITAYNISISTDLINWQHIDQVEAKNNSVITVYESAPLIINSTDTIYIQLSEINSSDGVKNLAIKTIANEDLNKPLLFPNPCLQGETVKILSNNSDKYEVYNISGALIFANQGSIIPTTALSPGVYIIKFLDSGYSTRLIIQ